MRLKNESPKLGVMSSGDAEVELLTDDLRLFSGKFWQILPNPGYFLPTV